MQDRTTQLKFLLLILLAIPTMGFWFLCNGDNNNPTGPEDTGEDAIRNFHLEAGGDSDNFGLHVNVLWQCDLSQEWNYHVYFKAVSDADFRVVGEVDHKSSHQYSWLHDPLNSETGEYETGQYRVSFYDTGDVENETMHSVTVSTVPLIVDPEVIYELHSAADVPGRSSGWGWDSSTGEALFGDVTDPAFAGELDFYVSDLDSGWQEQNYYLISPASGPTVESDAELLPDVELRNSMFFLLGRNIPYPDTVSVGPGVGLTDRWVILSNAYYLLFTESGHYAILEPSDQDNVEGTVNIGGYYQSIEGLRLFQIE